MGTAAAEADTYIDSFNNTSNFGSDTTAVVGSAGTQVLRILLRFDHADIPGSVSNVSVVLPVASYLGTRTTYDLHALNYSLLAGDWSESQATWDEYVTSLAWGSAGGDYIASPKVSWDSTGAPTGENSIVVSSLLSTSRLAGDSKFTILIKKQTETGTNTVTISTLNDSNGAYLTWVDSDEDDDQIRYRRNMQRDLHNRLWPRRHF